MFAWYDFETTGTSAAFDQPLQFAAILTDDNFNQIERINIRCRLSPHILPAPWALVVTGVSPEQLTDPTLPSWFEFTRQLREIVERWAPATWVGYNSLTFDEQFFRQSFYQCLQPNLYETQWNGNDRLDVLRVVYAIWELANNTLAWPLDDNGRNTFKLDRLAPANGFTQHDAHDALGDVEATIHISKLIRERAPEVWDQALQNRTKAHVNDLLATGEPIRLIERFGARPPRSYFGCFSGRNPQNPNSIGFYDLDGGDPDELLDGDDDAIMAAVSASPKRIRTVAVNNVPSLFEKTPPDPLHVQRAAMITARPDFQQRVGQALANRFADADPSDHVEERIYEGFYGAPDKSLLNRWQTASWPERHEMVGAFENDRLKALSRRLVYLEAPHLLSMEVQAQMDEALRQRWSSDVEGKWTTRDTVNIQLDEIRTKDAADQKTLEALERFYEGLLSHQ